MTALIAQAAHGPLCARIVDRLVSSVGDARFKRYFQPSARLRFDGNELAISVPTAFCADWLDRQFGLVLRDAARAESGHADVSLRWTVAPDEFAGAETNALAVQRAADLLTSGRAPEPAPSVAHLDNSPGLALPLAVPTDHAPSESTTNPLLKRHRLEEFVVGESNRLAYNAALRLADGPSERGPFGVLFIHGTSGVGKTHLLQGIARRFTQNRPRARVRYVTGEQFANEFIAGIQSGSLEAFRKRYRGLDLLCLDDVHFLGGKTKTQDEFLHTFDTLELGGARVALASDEHPRLLQRLSRQISSRFVSGMVVKVDAPDHATRLGLVSLLSARRGIALSPETQSAVASACAGSVREIEGALLRVEAMSRLLEPESGGAITPALVRRALGDDAGSTRVRRPVRIATIVAVVCEQLAVEQTEVLGNGRHKRVVLARSISAHLARELTTQSYPEIARALGRDNHSTVVTACQRVKKQIEAGATCGCGPDLDGPLASLCEKLRNDVLRAVAA